MSDIQTAHSRLPLTRVLEDLGVPVEPGGSRHCPFCQKKSAELRDFKGIQRFKCWHVSCPTGSESMDAIDVIRYVKNLSKRDAIREFLTKAGVEVRPWKGGR
jgi:hypothetical protein